ncbi:hypothetical protein ACH474_31190 [Nocardia rhamnosiphila]|jgi:hypothetical protein|uniref:Uncharacterized protein n=1 Tax=Nocardia rhamnosiphila TaxID=426716 RepID=A0ABV2WVV3_9NOCA|nr:hypothetical protein [Nocardia rhamnosiphila]
MATGVGLHIAEYACTAAVVDDDGDPHFILREPVLYMSEDGDAALGGVVAPPGHSHTITGFVAAVGDPAGVVVDDGEAYRGEDLLATALFCLINLTAEHLNGPAEFYAAHPAGWDAGQVLALRGALDYLGLKSVALVGEDELPAGPAHLTPADTGRYFAESAGRAALAVVLETPAGATPPDPSTAQNSALDTIVMPKLGDGHTPAKAYSALVPALDPEATYGGPSLAAIAAGLAPATGSRPATGSVPAAGPRPATGTAAAVSTAAPAKPAAEAAATVGNRGPRRTAALVAAAAFGGLLIGALGVTAILRPGAAEPGEPTTSVTEAPPPPPPIQPQPVAPAPEIPSYTPEPTYEPEPTYTEEPLPAPPPVTVTETTPEPTAVPSSTTPEPSGPTLTEPTTETETTTTRTRPRIFPFPVPFRTEDPEMDLPDTGSKEGRQEEAR